MHFRFTICDLLWLAVVVAQAVGWWLDHRQQVDRYETLANSTNSITIKIRGQAT